MLQSGDCCDVCCSQVTVVMCVAVSDCCVLQSVTVVRCSQVTVVMCVAVR